MRTQPAAEQTAEYQGSNPAPDQSERVRVALVGGSGASATDDLYLLLRRRLVALNAFLALILAFLTVAVIAFDPPTDRRRVDTLDEILIGSLPWFGLVGLHLTAAWVLWRRPPRNLFRLRVFETATLVPLVGMNLYVGIGSYAYEPLQWAADEPPRVALAFVGRYANAGSLVWFFVITAYGAIIPNTLRRAALVTGLIAVSPIVLFLVFAGWVRPLDHTTASAVVFGLVLSNTSAVALVLFSTSRIEKLRRQASEARKLGQYVLKEQLGSGGMGEVYRAEHALLRRPCAIKLIRPEKADDPDALRRFEREVQITATLTHPNTVQVFDYGHAEDGTFYYVMEYLPGLTLEELVRQHGPLPPGRAVHFLRQVCAALGEAHARGLTHRDIKPGNVMVCERGGVCDVVKVLDFGLVRLPKEDADGGTLTREGTVAGTPAYMSPEQAGGEAALDPRSDLYSVGALAYFLLTGRPPFADRSAARMLAAHLYEPPGPLPAEVPPALAAVVMRCLAKVPAERWPDAASLEAAFADAVVPAWTARDAADWWARATDRAHEARADLAQATRTDPGLPAGEGRATAHPS